MAWSQFRGDPGSRNGSLDFIDAVSPGTSRVPSPYARPTVRMDHERPGVRLQRDFSEDHFSSSDERHSPVRLPPAKRRPPPPPVAFSLNRKTTALKTSSVGNSLKATWEEDVEDVRMEDSKYAASSVSPRRTTAVLTKKSEPALLKSLLLPTTSANQSVVEKYRVPPRKVQRASWTVQPNQSTKSAATAALSSKPVKVVARPSGAIATLTEVQEKTKHWWETEDSASSESEIDLVDLIDLVEKKKKRHLAAVRKRPVSSHVRVRLGDDMGDVVELKPRKKKPSFVLPELTTQDEKDLLGDIFNQLQNDNNKHDDENEDEDEKEDRPFLAKTVPATPPSTTPSAPRKKTQVARQLVESDTNSNTNSDTNSNSDSDSGSDSGSESSVDLKVHMNLGSLPVYNAATYSVSPANALPLPTAASVKGKTLRRLASEGKTKEAKEEKLGLSEGFVSLASVMKALPEGAGHWKVSRQDEMRAHGSYLQRREDRARLTVCHRCGLDVSHANRHYCTQTTCALCHGTDHWKEKCPFKDTVVTLNCRRCGQSGHVHAVCSEQWRQYHSTTSHSGPIVRLPERGSVKHACCYNCGNADHYGHECRRRAYDRSPLPFPNPFIKLYDQPRQFALHAGDDLDQHPLDEFHEFVTNNMTEDDSAFLSSNAGNRQKRTMRVAASGSSRKSSGGSPKKKKKNRKKIKNLG